MNPTLDVSIAVVCGGPSAEVEVSRMSGKCVTEALQKTYPKVVLLELDTNIKAKLEEHSVDVVFPALHGPPGEDGTFQGFLETIGCPYVGSGVRASAFAMDKTVAKHFFKQAGLPIARDLVLTRNNDSLETSKLVLESLGPDVVIKPSNQGSAVGVSFAKGQLDIENELRVALEQNEKVLIEERIAGKEITVGVLDVDGTQAFPVIEIRTPTGTWYDYEHRYTVGESEHVIPATISEYQYQRTQEIAVKAHSILGCRHLSRADFVVPEEGEPILLEVNTLPGMTPTSLFPDGAHAAGISFERLVVLLIEKALEDFSR